MVFSEFQDKLKEDELDGARSGIVQILQNLHHFDEIMEFYNRLIPAISFFNNSVTVILNKIAFIFGRFFLMILGGNHLEAFMQY